MTSNFNILKPNFICVKSLMSLFCYSDIKNNRYRIIQIGIKSGEIGRNWNKEKKTHHKQKGNSAAVRGGTSEKTDNKENLVAGRQAQTEAMRGKWLQTKSVIRFVPCTNLYFGSTDCCKRLCWLKICWANSLTSLLCLVDSWLVWTWQKLFISIYESKELISHHHLVFKWNGNYFLVKK